MALSEVGVCTCTLSLQAVLFREGFSSWVRFCWVLALFCPTEPVLGSLPSSPAAAEGLAKAQLLFLLRHKPPPLGTWRCRWHHLSVGQSRGLSPLAGQMQSGASGWCSVCPSSSPV